MINKNMINTSGTDLLKGYLSGVNTSQYFVPLFKIKLDPIAENDIQIETEFTVRWFSGGENYSNKYLAKFAISSNVPSLLFYKRSLNEGVGINLCFVKSDKYYILYAKGGNAYFNINAQIQYCNYPEEISMCVEEENIPIADISSYNPIYPSEKSTITITPGTGYYIASNDFHQHYELLRDGTCIISGSLYKNSVPVINEVICTISQKPILKKLPVLLFLRSITDSSIVEVCSGQLATNGELTLLTTPSVVTGKAYVIFQLVYDSINNSI